MSASITLWNKPGHSSVSCPWAVISGQTPGGMSWSTARNSSMATPCRHYFRGDVDLSLRVGDLRRQLQSCVDEEGLQMAEIPFVLLTELFLFLGDLSRSPRVPEMYQADTSGDVHPTEDLRHPPSQ